MQLKLSKRTVDGILAIGCSGRIVFGEESSLLRDEIKKAIRDVHAEDQAEQHQQDCLPAARWKHSGRLPSLLSFVHRTRGVGFPLNRDPV